MSSLFPFLLRRWSRRGSFAPATCLVACAVGWVQAATSATPEDILAWWSFDEGPADRAPATLRDQGPREFGLILMPGARLVAGRVGSALHGGARLATKPAGPAAARTSADHPLGSGLNLGERAWTVEAWLRLEPAAQEEGVLLELGAEANADTDLITRLAIAPRENAFVLRGLAPFDEAVRAPLARRVEFPDPSGPPSGQAQVLIATLVADRPLPRGRWFHAAVVHSEAGELRLFLDGRACAVAHADLRPLPSLPGAYLTVGCDGRGRRAFPGAIDELRVRDRAAFLAPFDPAAELRDSPLP